MFLVVAVAWLFGWSSGIAFACGVSFSAPCFGLRQAWFFTVLYTLARSPLLAHSFRGALLDFNSLQILELLLQPLQSLMSCVCARPKHGRVPMDFDHGVNVKQI